MKRLQECAPKRIYVAVPYSHPDKKEMDDRYDAVTEFSAKLMGLGHVVFSTITYTHDMAKRYSMPTNYYEWWYNMNLSFIKWAETIVVLCIDGCEESRGVSAEIHDATLLGKEIVYIEP